MDGIAHASGNNLVHSWVLTSEQRLDITDHNRPICSACAAGLVKVDRHSDQDSKRPFQGPRSGMSFALTYKPRNLVSNTHHSFLQHTPCTFTGGQSETFTIMYLASAITAAATLSSGIIFPLYIYPNESCPAWAPVEDA